MVRTCMAQVACTRTKSTAAGTSPGEESWASQNATEQNLTCTLELSQTARAVAYVLQYLVRLCTPLCCKCFCRIAPNQLHVDRWPWAML